MHCVDRAGNGPRRHCSPPRSMPFDLMNEGNRVIGVLDDMAGSFWLSLAVGQDGSGVPQGRDAPHAPAAQHAGREETIVPGDVIGGTACGPRQRGRDIGATL
jgi:hypothetical protein